MRLSNAFAFVAVVTTTCDCLAQTPIQESSVISQQRRVEFPSELRSSVEAYSACLQNEMNAQLRIVGSVPIGELQAFHSSVVKRCVAVRVEALEKGAARLAEVNAGKDDTERRSTVEAVLAMLEAPPTPPSGPVKK